MEGHPQYCKLLYEQNLQNISKLKYILGLQPSASLNSSEVILLDVETNQITKTKLEKAGTIQSEVLLINKNEILILWKSDLLKYRLPDFQVVIAKEYLIAQAIRFVTTEMFLMLRAGCRIELMTTKNFSIIDGLSLNKQKYEFLWNIANSQKSPNEFLLITLKKILVAVVKNGKKLMLKENEEYTFKDIVRDAIDFQDGRKIMAFFPGYLNIINRKKRQIERKIEVLKIFGVLNLKRGLNCWVSTHFSAEAYLYVQINPSEIKRLGLINFDVSEHNSPEFNNMMTFVQQVKNECSKTNTLTGNGSID